MKDTKQFWKDRAALSFAAVGIVLMILTLMCRVNPVEQSVVRPRFLEDTPTGMGILWVLLVTCMPVWIAILTLTEGLGLSSIPVFSLGAISLQGIVYFLIAKAVSFCVRKLWRKKRSLESGLQTKP